MAKGKQPRNTWILVLMGVVPIILVTIVIVLDLSTPIHLKSRAVGLLGYCAVFFACISSAYMRELMKHFGRPFLKVHHFVSVVGLVLLGSHAIGIVWDAAAPRLFLPFFESPRAFLVLGGSPALWLFGIAALVAVMRKTIGKNWKLLHQLNYVAFLLGTVHAQMLGTDFKHLAVRAVSLIMAGAVLYVFGSKRWQEYQRKRNAAKR